MANWDSFSGENYQTHPDFNHSYPSSSTYGDSVFYDHHYSGFSPMSYSYCDYGSETISESVGYSVFTLSEPKHVVYEYDPNCYSVYEIESPSEFRISYSVSEFNETDFEEYDPTPYGGGYDISATYGEALPPSDKTCYPCPSADPTMSPALASVPLGPVDEKDKVINGFASVPVKESKPMQTIDEEEEEEDDDDDDDDGDGFVSDHANETKPVERMENVDEEKVKVRYIPSGYGLEAMDLCETIFGGYFPCLLSKQRCNEERNPSTVSWCERNDLDPWKKTSDYLFGDLYPYSHDGRSHSENLYGYEWH
ncbi:PREDICTED: uncharacterized protein LOC104809531 [Tarenaya hassleriana]|uniref:uncharacterized protein LOC104809531 n=1 Tax=Tarenaya hassleriana TaxID=28532 RepID=UPI00053C648C|nr:PREDICTED: uncharacterized protein LOC104809531 [Tarenaya hassleriana]